MSEAVVYPHRGKMSCSCHLVFLVQILHELNVAKLVTSQVEKGEGLGRGLATPTVKRTLTTETTSENKDYANGHNTMYPGVSYSNIFVYNDEQIKVFTNEMIISLCFAQRGLCSKY